MTSVSGRCDEEERALAFSSALSRSFLLNDSTQSVKHFCTRELYMRRLHTTKDSRHSNAL